MEVTMSNKFNESVRRGGISVETQHIFPIIKKWVYSDHDIFFRELISNGCDAITKLKKLDLMGEYDLPEDYKAKLEVIVNPEEKSLAEQYETISKTLSIHELKVIDKAIKEATAITIESTFYDRFHLFVITHGRFPCGNSDDPEEVKLNNLYVTMSELLTKEQIKELSRLKKLYSKATLQANMDFAKKRK